jgi:hypothetical protein
MELTQPVNLLSSTRLVLGVGNCSTCGSHGKREIISKWGHSCNFNWWEYKWTRTSRFFGETTLHPLLQLASGPLRKGCPAPVLQSGRCETLPSKALPHTSAYLGAKLAYHRRHKGRKGNKQDGTEHVGDETGAHRVSLCCEWSNEAITVPLHPYNQRPARMQWR